MSAEVFTSESRTVTEEDVDRFAELTGDRHPAHTDQAWAEENLFGERVAHGLLVVSFAIGLVPTDRFVALRRIKNVVFKAPVRIGDTIHAEMQMDDERPIDDDLSLGSGRVKVLREDGETALKMQVDALVRRSPD